ncbi:hypothetical protein BDD12DRAFT_152553 [Trichophaea hybrida]|nr:hypothetical protein BDD12DRAFT_152553 [Trichophaea hybrida]
MIMTFFLFMISTCFNIFLVSAYLKNKIPGFSFTSMFGVAQGRGCYYFYHHHPSPNPSIHGYPSSYLRGRIWEGINNNTHVKLLYLPKIAHMT